MLESNGGLDEQSLSPRELEGYHEQAWKRRSVTEEDDDDFDHNASMNMNLARPRQYSEKVIVTDQSS